MSSLTRQQLESWLKTIEIKDGNVLDVGGSQNPLSKSRLRVFEPDEYKILDLEVPHECKQKSDIIWDLNIQGLFLSEQKTEIIDKLNSYWDIVFCLEVMEYIFNPIQALENINFLLKKGGLFYSSWHFIYPVHNPKEQDFLRYTPRGLEKLLKETGFEILEMKPRLIEYSKMWGNFYTREEMRPAKDCDKQNWQGCLVKCEKI